MPRKAQLENLVPNDKKNVREQSYTMRHDIQFKLGRRSTRSIINIMYFFSFLHFPFDTPSLMEIPFSMLLYMRGGVRGGLRIRAMDMAVSGWRGGRKKDC